MGNEKDREVKEKLIEAVQDAALHYEAAQSRWKNANEEWSTDPAHPDGNLAMRLVRRERKTALEDIQMP